MYLQILPIRLHIQVIRQRPHNLRRLLLNVVAIGDDDDFGGDGGHEQVVVAVELDLHWAGVINAEEVLEEFVYVAVEVLVLELALGEGEVV